MNITAPIIHLNGTDGIQLLAGYEEAHEKLQEFIEAWSRIQFNGRDYYPLGDKAFGDAITDRGIADTSITSVRYYLLEHIFAIQDQVTELGLRRPPITHPESPQTADNTQPAVSTLPDAKPAQNAVSGAKNAYQ